MHPDQFTPDDHRTTADNSADTGADQAMPAQLPAEDQHLSGSAADVTSQNVATPQTEGARTGEAGNSYMGREMDDDLKANPRVDDARDVERPE
jgi:hypothetical protein